MIDSKKIKSNPQLTRYLHMLHRALVFAAKTFGIMDYLVEEILALLTFACNLISGALYSATIRFGSQTST
jgi:hypothetical protein